MNRPSQKIDARLIASGMVLLPQTGCAGLSVRKLVEHAGVNLGMFHYHFKNKDNFLRVLLQHLYEDMFAALTLRAQASRGGARSLDGALRVLAGFASGHRHLLLMLLSEAMRGEALPAAFLRENLPRHIAVLARLLRQGQAEGDIIDAPPMQLLPFVLGAIAGPLFAGGALERLPAAAPELAALAQQALLSEQAIGLRIDLAMRAILTAPKEFAAP
ncbi:TetR/AcrR family transcriptional regulator [Massilia violaceinigra]|uniref:TetR/AcrR family transcriptional regulator n=1 Tax=Massilia violaceinigra TaxID=2045208 RepID=A0ABY4AD26_9BURK|nr:TetR/AcrR family transcriptional regulator [Massilia violaceinigra]UOD32710.1 TetR/AcrR family transcriptional regulator [Massilia violaceinigra]